MIPRTEISIHWQNENDSFRFDPPTILLGIKEACFAARRYAQKGFREGFEAGERRQKAELQKLLAGKASSLSEAVNVLGAKTLSEALDALEIFSNERQSTHAS